MGAPLVEGGSGTLRALQHLHTHSTHTLTTHSRTSRAGGGGVIASAAASSPCAVRLEIRGTCILELQGKRPSPWREKRSGRGCARRRSPGT